MSVAKAEKLYDIERYFVVAISNVEPRINLIWFKDSAYVRVENGFIASEELIASKEKIIWP